MSKPAKAGDAAKGGVPFEEALKKLEGIVDAMEADDLPLETLLARYEAQLTGTSSAVDGLVTKVVSFQGRDAKLVSEKIPELLQGIQTEQNELKQFDADLEKSSLI